MSLCIWEKAVEVEEFQSFKNDLENTRATGSFFFGSRLLMWRGSNIIKINKIFSECPTCFGKRNSQVARRN